MKKIAAILFWISVSTGIAQAESEKPWLSIQPWWIPMCFLVDPALTESSVNQRIDKIVTEYAGCGINVRPFAFTLMPDYPKDLEKLKAAAMIACPLNEEFGVRGAIQVETASTDLPKQMCGDSSAQGCSTQCEPVSFSIVAAGSKPEVALRESMRGNCCGPLCVDEGQGNGRRAGLGLELTTYSLETPSKTLAPTGKFTAKYDILPQGCHALRTGASTNSVTQWFQKRNTVHYKKAPVKERYQLGSGKSFFQDGAVRLAKDVKADPEPLKNTVVETDSVNKLIRNLSSDEKKKK